MKKQQRWWYSRSRSSASVPATPRAAGLAPECYGGGGGGNVGCMSMVQYLIFAPGAGCVGRPPAPSPPSVAAADSRHFSDLASSPRSKGVEAPRNSLELDADELREVQIGVQIEPAFDALLPGRRSRATAPSSEVETPRTPSLVARLMGIDGLPDQSSPSPGLKKARPPSTTTRGGGGKNQEDRPVPAAAVREKKKRVIPESMNKEQPSRQPLRSLSCNVPAHAGESRSLPDTPRASTSSASARAAPTWDVVVDRPRLSLQVLKESVLDRAAQYMSMPTSPTSGGGGKKKKDRDGHRRRDAKEHAREIVRQAKETVTNRKSGKKPASTRSSDKENVSPFADEKLVVVQVQPAPSKPTAPSPSPPPQLLKERANEQQPHAPRLPPPPPPLRAKPSRPPPPPPQPDHPAPSRVVVPAPPQAVKNKRPPDGCERFATRIKKPAPAAPASPSTGAPVSSTDSSSADHHRSHRAASTSSRPLEEDPEHSYLRSVLERGGFMRATPPPPHHRPFKGHSVASPVDPIVFHLLELELPTDDPRLGPLRHRWNRKLLFHLAQEILADLLLAVDPSRIETSPPFPHGAPLLRKVWGRVKALPAADCRVVGDIDALVATDLHAAGSVRGLARHPAVAEEAGDVADDVAELLLDALLGECCG